MHDLNVQVASRRTEEQLIIVLDTKKAPIAQIWCLGSRNLGILLTSSIQTALLKGPGSFLYPLSYSLPTG